LQFFLLQMNEPKDHLITTNIVLNASSWTMKRHK